MKRFNCWLRYEFSRSRNISVTTGFRIERALARGKTGGSMRTYFATIFFCLSVIRFVQAAPASERHVVLMV